MYRDSFGFNTIGYGHCLDYRPISKQAAQVILDDDLKWFIKSLERSFPPFNHLNDVRQAVILDMAFNLGMLGISKFHNMWYALNHKDYEKAADEMLHSKWAKQVGQRAEDNARLMRSGKIWDD